MRCVTDRDVNTGTYRPNFKMWLKYMITAAKNQNYIHDEIRIILIYINAHICPEILRKTTKTLNQDSRSLGRGLNPEPGV
jgi:hypothetical protein